MKSVMISIQPYWIFIIIAKKMGWNIDKEKTVEVRKTRPKDNDWNKTVKIYCSKDRKSFAKIPKEYQPLMEQFLGKVIGEFVCGEIIEFYEETLAHDELDGNPVEAWMMWNMSDNLCEVLHLYEMEDVERCTCLTSAKILSYLHPNMNGYGWHISDLVIYDKPKELREFHRECEEPECDDCPYLHFENTPNSYEGWCIYGEKIPLTRPPQSWCYVDSIE